MVVYSTTSGPLAVGWMRGRGTVSWASPAEDSHSQSLKGEEGHRCGLSLCVCVCVCVCLCVFVCVCEKNG